MRIALPVAALAVAVGLVLSGCTTSTVVKGSEVAVAVADPLTSLNPATSYGRSSVTNGDVASLTGTGFAYYDDGYGIVEDGSFGTAEIVAQDPLTVRYTVSADARWSDGTPVDAADLLLAWAANSGALNTPDFDDADWVDPATGRYREDFPTDVVYFDGAIGAGLEKASQIPQISEDGRTIFLHFDEFVSTWRLALAPGLPAHVVAAEALGVDGDAQAAKDALVAAILGADDEALGAIARTWNDAYNVSETPDDPALLVAAGPYVVAEIGTEEVRLEANEAYRGDRRPTFETIRIRISPDPLETVSLLAAGEVDIVSPEPSAEVIDALVAVDGVSVVAGSEGRFEHLDLQFADGRSGALDDQAVREAFLSVVPRQAILDELVVPVQQDAVLLDSFVFRPGARGYADAIAENGSDAYAETDVDRAVALLEEAGVAAPEVCILYDPANPRRITEFQLIRDSATRAGFVVTDCSNPDWEGLLGVAGAYDAAIFAWDTTRLGPAAVGAVYRSDSDLANFNRYDNPDVDALVDELDGTDDPDEQSRILGEIDARLWSDAYGVPLFSYPTVTAVRDTVTGVTRSPLARTVFWNAWEWRPAED
jgi:peptide/nickel transport system substrate-binding protein